MNLLIKENYIDLNDRRIHFELIYYRHYVCMKDGFYIKASTGRDYIAQQEIYILPATRVTQKAKGTAYRMYCGFIDTVESKLDELRPLFDKAAHLDKLDREYLEQRAARIS